MRYRIHTVSDNASDGTLHSFDTPSITDNQRQAFLDKMIISHPIIKNS